MMRMNKTFDELMIENAHNFAKLSKCTKLQVCALIVKDGRIISTGLNGTPKGCTFNCNDIFTEDYFKVIKDEQYREEHFKFQTNFEIHAEQNAIGFCAKEGISLKDTTIYITDSPCINCAKLIVASGIKKVVFDRIYTKDTQFIQLFELSGIEYVDISMKR